MASTFGDRIKFLRKEKNLKQSEFGEVFGLSPSAIGSYERNLREPAYKHLTEFANFFNVSVDYLLCRTDERLTVDRYRENDTYEFFDMLEKFKVTLHDYVLDTDDKQRIFDVTVGMLWAKVSKSHN